MLDKEIETEALTAFRAIAAALEAMADRARWQRRVGAMRYQQHKEPPRAGDRNDKTAI
jgi:hypothetical protein